MPLSLRQKLLPPTAHGDAEKAKRFGSHWRSLPSNRESDGAAEDGIHGS